MIAPPPENQASMFVAADPLSAGRAKSTLISRNVTIAGNRTSIRLEPEMWDGIREICRREKSSLHQICTLIAQQKPPQTSLTAAIRVYAMRYYRMAATEDGHVKAGHGYSPVSAAHTQHSPHRQPLEQKAFPLTKDAFA
jgi:predicted DNA-binding ribbon-helix-helix protein